MKSNYLNKNIQTRLDAYSSLLKQFNSGKLSPELQTKLIKLSSLIIQDLVDDKIKSKKQNLMDQFNAN